MRARGCETADHCSEGGPVPRVDPSSSGSCSTEEGDDDDGIGGEADGEGNGGSETGDGGDDENTQQRAVLQARLRQAQLVRDSCEKVGRVLVACSTPQHAQRAAKLCDKLGVSFHVYCGKGGTVTASEKREHFRNTTKHWWQAECIIATTTLCVACVRVVACVSWRVSVCGGGDALSRGRTAQRSIIH